MKADSAIGLVPPLAHFASGGNYPIIRMMKSEWLPLLAPCSHICLCPNRIDPFESINFIFGVDAGVLSTNLRFTHSRDAAGLSMPQVPNIMCFMN